MRAISCAAADLVLAVPVPDVAVLQKPAAVGVYVHALRIIPDAAVRQRKSRRRKERRNNENIAFHTTNYTQTRYARTFPSWWDVWRRLKSLFSGLLPFKQELQLEKAHWGGGERKNKLAIG